jgi:hypothetical protein
MVLGEVGRGCGEDSNRDEKDELVVAAAARRDAAAGKEVS